MRAGSENESMLSPAKIAVELTAEEALVLFEWLAQFEKNPAAPPPLAGTPEEQVLWSVQGQLEKQLVEPFDSNYKAFLTEARDRVRAKGASD
jgi:hypothetical protein